MRAKGRSQKLSRLIPKFHFCSVPVFREEPLINWTYTEAVLFTAYDVYRSNDYWLDNVVNSGSTLKEALIDLGFPKSNALVVDTGVFELEAKKAGLSRELGIDVTIELTNAQIFEAYELSGADFFVAPDEIILPLDCQEVIKEKVEKIKHNLLGLLDIVPPSQVIAVIQGHDQKTVDDLLEFYRENGISVFAVGGVIPLYHHDKELLQNHLMYVRNATRTKWLHIFGLPRMSLLSYYLHNIQVDSVDTSTLTYLTARRRYLVGLKPEQVRLVDFKECKCPGCVVLAENIAPRSPEFFVNLYIHNIITAAKESLKEVYAKIEPQSKTKQADRKKPKPSIDKHRISWMTAEEALLAKRQDRSV